MKTSVFKTVLLMAGISLSSLTFAQQKDLRTPEERASFQTARMTEKLKLSSGQENTVASINLTYARQNQVLLETGGRNLRTARQLQTQMKKKDGELKTVLNQEQYQQYLAMKESMKSELKTRRRQN
ncbi:hypothetical protein GCM10027347_22250 [Larkinella harenae]